MNIIRNRPCFSFHLFNFACLFWRCVCVWYKCVCLYVCVFVCGVYVCVYDYVCARAHACIPCICMPRPEEDVGHLAFSSPCLIPLRQGFSWSLELGWQSSSWLVGIGDLNLVLFLIQKALVLNEKSSYLVRLAAFCSNCFELCKKFCQYSAVEVLGMLAHGSSIPKGHLPHWMLAETERLWNAMIRSKFLGSSEASITYGIADCGGDRAQPCPFSLATEVIAWGSEGSLTLLCCPTCDYPPVRMFTHTRAIYWLLIAIFSLLPQAFAIHTPVSDLNKSHYKLQNEENCNSPMINCLTEYVKNATCHFIIKFSAQELIIALENNL